MTACLERNGKGYWGLGRSLGINHGQPDSQCHALPPSSLSPTAHSQVSLTWSQTPTMCKRPPTSREPTYTPCAVQQKRIAWPGKELRMKLGALGQSPGVTQNPLAYQAANVRGSNWPSLSLSGPGPRHL